jgi:hypothetical protein
LSKVLKATTADKFSVDDKLGVAIRKIGATQFHCGVLYAYGGEVKLLHLARNFDLRDEAPTSNYGWADVAVAPADKALVAILAKKFAHAKNKVPYGFERNGITIDNDNGQLVTTTQGKGLTCATLVTLLFETHGLPLLREGDWPEMANIEWQTDMLRDLRSLVPLHAQAVERDIGCRRFTPQEVVGAATIKKWPVGWEDARKIAVRVTREVERLSV